MVKPNIPADVYDVVIIGGGPAGLTAGLYAARAGQRVLLIEGASTISQITATDMVENYPGIPDGISGFELVEQFKKQALKFGLEIIAADVEIIEQRRCGDINGWCIETAKHKILAIAVIVATGANWKKLGVPGEDDFIGKGVSYCATCDGPFYKGKEIAVVGGGNTAIQEAVFLTRFAEKVNVIHRRDRLRATKILQERAFANSKINFVFNSVVEQIAGSDGVQEIRIKNLKTQEKGEIRAEGIFIFVGLKPLTSFLKNVVELSEDGYVLVDSNMQTSARGIFACGDCIKKRLRQVITACGDGATAAFSAQLYIEEVKGETY